VKLDGVKLEKVIQIIHEDIPEIRDVSLISSLNFKLPLTHGFVYLISRAEKIELEISMLPEMVLMKQVSARKGTGTGESKWKSMDKDVKAEKIQQLEERMLLFEGNDNAGPVSMVPKDDSDCSLDSSLTSDSSAWSCFLFLFSAISLLHADSAYTFLTIHLICCLDHSIIQFSTTVAISQMIILASFNDKTFT
jgi:hypothetical protein